MSDKYQTTGEGMLARKINYGGNTGAVPIDLIEQRNDIAHLAVEVIDTLTSDLQQANKDKAELVEVLEELADLMDAVIEGEYEPDSFTTQPASLAIVKHKEDV